MLNAMVLCSEFYNAERSYSVGHNAESLYAECCCSE